MYDNLTLWIPIGDKLTSLDLFRLSERLDNLKEIADYNSIQRIGNMRSMFFRIKPTGVLITGSICKFHFGNNQQTLTLEDARAALQTLESTTELPLDHASVYRIDLAENYIMNEPEHLYYDYLGSSTHYNRFEKNNGLYYNNTRRTLIFYGKIKEQKFRDVPIIKEFQDKNVLRYELRFTNKIPVQVNLSKVTVANLVEKDFYKKLLIKYRDEYHAIQKRHKIVLEKSSIKNQKEFMNQVLLAGAIALGGEQTISDMIASLKLEGVFKNNMQHMRLKNKVKEILRTPNLTKPSELILELDAKINAKIARELDSL